MRVLLAFQLQAKSGGYLVFSVKWEGEAETEPLLNSFFNFANFLSPLESMIANF